LACGLALAAVIISPAKADIFFGTDGFTGDLVKIDSVTGVSTLIGNTGHGTMVGLAVNGNTSVAYTRDFFNLYTIDLTTGATTLVGASGPFITGLAFDASYSTLYSVDQSNGMFYSVDPMTGAATAVGNTGISVPLDLSTNSAGIVHAASVNGGIYTINTVTGLATQLWASISGMTGITAISFDSSDNLFAVDITSDVLYKIDLGTGVGTAVGPPNVRQDIRGLDFARGPRDPGNQVPEPGSAALLLGSGVVGVLAFRRRR
jgi:sugar lactone lactonase YvrE